LSHRDTNEVIGVRMMLLAALALCCCAFAQDLVREGNMEKLVIASGADAEAWGVAEATMTSTAERAKTGQAALQFHIDVNHHAGEKAYPVGWPRTNRPFDEEWQRDWSDYDFLRLWIYADTSREKLPSAPLGLILYTPDKASAYHRSLTEVQKGEWVEIVIPVSKIARHENVTRVQFFISESSYTDHDVVDFYVDDMCLLRYAEPHLSQVVLQPSVVYADTGRLAVSFRASGIPQGERVRAKATVVGDGRKLVSAETLVGRGPGELVMGLAGRAAEGRYKVLVDLAGGTAQEFDLRVIESPWAEE